MDSDVNIRVALDLNHRCGWVNEYAKSSMGLLGPLLLVDSAQVCRVARMALVTSRSVFRGPCYRYMDTKNKNRFVSPILSTQNSTIFHIFTLLNACLM